MPNDPSSSESMSFNTHSGIDPHDTWPRRLDGMGRHIERVLSSQKSTASGTIMLRGRSSSIGCQDPKRSGRLRSSDFAVRLCGDLRMVNKSDDHDPSNIKPKCKQLKFHISVAGTTLRTAASSNWRSCIGQTIGRAFDAERRGKHSENLHRFCKLRGSRITSLRWSSSPLVQDDDVDAILKRG